MALTTAQQTEIAKAVRAPRGLLEIKYKNGALTLRFATGGNVTWNSLSWTQSGITVSNIKGGKGGIQSARFTVSNQSYGLSRIAVARDFHFQEVNYWEYYGTGNPALADPIKRFSGEIVRIPGMGSTIVFDCATKGATTKTLPNYSPGSPDLNHMPRSGQRIPIGNTVYTVEIR